MAVPKDHRALQKYYRRNTSTEHAKHLHKIMNYWEHIVRNEPELTRIREYIHDNTAQWERNSLNAGKSGSRTAPAELRKPIAKYGVEAWMI